MMGQSVVAVIQGRYHHGDHLSLRPLDGRTAIHNRLIEEDVGLQRGRVQAVNFQNVVNAAPRFYEGLIEFAEFGVCVCFRDYVNPGHEHLISQLFVFGARKSHAKTPRAQSIYFFPSVCDAASFAPLRETISFFGSGSAESGRAKLAISGIA